MKRIALLILSCSLPLVAQESATCPMQKEHESKCPMHDKHAKGSDHHADVDRRGDQAMGFAHDKTTHHFRLLADGGAIEVTANSMKDEESQKAIRQHLGHIAKMFADGDFSTPFAVHDQVPPGVPMMKAQRKQISYTYEEMPAGARVRIQTANPDALKAIHEFLRFQIEEHATGDAEQVTSQP
ncbi:MAG TPA: hypothetical protein VEW69_12150 [Alphaproteobacteria bacterium]|nr:hypothetical protein [Alphaproteobacteria bacterium]